MDNLPHIVIVGAGFGGMEAARRLAKAAVRVTLIDRNNYHLFQPLLYQVAIAGLSPEQIAYPIRSIFRRQRNFTFLMDEVTGIEPESRCVVTRHKRIEYDYLILSAGGQTNFYGICSVEKNALQVKNISSAVATRNHLLRMFEQASREPDPALRRKLLTFVIVGGGPTGVETAGALAELIRLVLTKDFPSLNLDETRVLLLEANGEIMRAFPESLRKATRNSLHRKHVEVRFGAVVEDYDGQIVRLKSGESIPTLTLIWAAGMRATNLADQLETKQDGLGRVHVEPTLQVPGFPEIFVIGDGAFVDDEEGPLPMLATVAIQQARAAAHNIRRALKGLEAQPFKYKDPGLLATIGRNEAVAHIWGLSFHGFLAWMIWLGLHILRIIGFRNRLVVLIHWAWEYFFYDRAVRLITSE
jgi:NADH dehydrogenase